MKMDQPEANIYEFGDFRLDAAKRLLLKGGDEPVPLMPKAFDTLLYLVRHSGRVIEKDELMREIWTDTIVEENNLNQNISILRRVFGEKRGEHRFIATIPGKGYKFVAEVTAVANGSIRSFDIETGAEKSSRDRIPKNKGRIAGANITNRLDLLALTVLGVLALSSIGFYLWRENSKSTSADTSIKTVAVLPFKPLVAENRDEVLEMGMADTLIAQLGNNQKIIVLPLSSVRKYGNLEQNAMEAGKELGADSVLDGSIQRWGDKIRVNVRLIKVADGTSVWTGTFDEKFPDIFVVQDSISKRVVSALAIQLSGDEQTLLKKRQTNNAEAYEFYLRGRYHVFKITRPEILKAIGYFQKAIDADPNYALAYAGMADAYRTQAIAAFAPSNEVCPQAKALALRTLEIDDSLAEAHIVLGWVGFLFDWDWENAERELKKAIELAPNDSEAHRAYAHFLSNSGRHEEAVAEGKRARELAPLTLITAALESQFLIYAGRYDEATARLDKTLELDQNFWLVHNYLGRVYILQGRNAEAIAEFTKARELSAGGTTEPIAQLGYALAISGKRNEALAILKELKSFAAENYVPMYFFALIYNGLGNREMALSYLEKSFDNREVQLTFIKIDTRWDKHRADGRFVDLIRKMNLQL